MIAPTFNNAEGYRYHYHLQAIYNLEYPADKVKLVIIDDVSSDGTADLIQHWLDTYKPRFSY